MLHYFIRRLLYMLALLIGVSIFAFFLIELPPGSYVDTHIAQLEQEGQTVNKAEIESLKKRYGLDQPTYVRYFKWMGGMLRGDMGISYQWNQPVTDIIAERLPTTIAVALLSALFTYAVAIPIGIYSAVRQYSIGDYVFTVLGFIGMAIPHFFFAMVLMVFSFKWFGISVGGLFSPEYLTAPWSMGKFIDLLKHLPIPMIVIGLAGAAGLIRVMRACLLDELQKQYVTTARARGVSEIKLLFKYPVRLALNPIISTVGWLLPRLVSGTVVVAIVMNLPTLGPVLFGALKSQDTYLAGSIVLFLTVLTVIGVFLSDVLLAITDPRIRYE